MSQNKLTAALVVSQANPKGERTHSQVILSNENLGRFLRNCCYSSKAQTDLIHDIANGKVKEIGGKNVGGAEFVMHGTSNAPDFVRVATEKETKTLLPWV